MFQLRQYQELLIEGVRDEFRQGRRHTCVVAPCGSGKTIIMAWMTAQTAVKGNRVLFAVHRQELIDQSSRTFQAMNIPHGIIAAGYPLSDEQIQVGSIFTIVRRVERIKSPGVIIIDECFPAGTMIDGRPIETLKTGDVVTAWDEKQNKLVNGRVKSVFRRPANSLLCVQAGSFTVICTPNHPFLTQRGWIPAGLLSVSKDFTLQIKDGGKVGGSQEGKTAYWIRVDNIEILEPGSDGTFGGLCPDSYVYNFEVEKYHTYTANGFIVHNCHHSTANTWRKLLAAYPEAYVIGLTATPARLGGEGLGDIFESLVLGPSVKQLIDWGNLAPYKYYAPPVKANLEGLRVRYGDYIKSDIALRMDKSEIIGDAIEQYQRLVPGKRAVCYCVSRAHSEHTAEMFRATGVPAVHIDGETPDAVRKAAIEQFRTGEVLVICNVDLISEGFDVPAMEAVILTRPTQSLTLHIQQSMRPMRPDADNPDKVAVIIDHVGNVYRHGLPDEDRAWSLEGSKKKGQSSPREVALRQCPKCYAAHRPAPSCPLCGYKYAPAERSEPTQRRGELVKIDELERKRRRQEVGRARNITDLEQIALRRGYSLRWIAKMAEVKRIPGVNYEAGQ